MLCLSRKTGEQIKIGDNIVITVLPNRHGRVSLGIEAPKDVPVVRCELLAQDKKETSSDATL